MSSSLGKLKTPNHPDYWLLIFSGSLLALGVLILSSVSAPLSQERFGTTYYFLKHQLLFAVLPGLILGFLAYKIDLNLVKKWAPFLFLATLLLMLMVFMPFIGLKQEGASRWIGIGSFSFQPSELLKLSFVLYLAALFGSKLKKDKRPKFGQMFFVLLAAFFLITLILFFQSDISTWGVICLTAVLIYFAANTPLWHTGAVFVLASGMLLTLIKLAPYRINRLLVFLNPEIDPLGIGYQTKQALITLGSGGIKGVGLGMSQHKFGFLPQPLSDSIFAIFSEEAGFIGATTLILLFLLFFWRGFIAAKKAPDKFSQLAALGITSWIAIQTFVNIGAMTGILPLTGIPLPFISYGGSALITELIALGLLLNISKRQRQETV